MNQFEGKCLGNNINSSISEHPVQIDPQVDTNQSFPIIHHRRLQSKSFKLWKRFT